MVTAVAHETFTILLQMFACFMPINMYRILFWKRMFYHSNTVLHSCKRT